MTYGTTVLHLSYSLQPENVSIQLEPSGIIAKQLTPLLSSCLN